MAMSLACSGNARNGSDAILRVALYDDCEILMHDHGAAIIRWLGQDTESFPATVIVPCRELSATRILSVSRWLSEVDVDDSISLTRKSYWSVTDVQGGKDYSLSTDGPLELVAFGVLEQLRNDSNHKLARAIMLHENSRREAAAGDISEAYRLGLIAIHNLDVWKMGYCLRQGSLYDGELITGRLSSIQSPTDEDLADLDKAWNSLFPDNWHVGWSGDQCELMFKDVSSARDTHRQESDESDIPPIIGSAPPGPPLFTPSIAPKQAIGQLRAFIHIP
jgi:hypothetical protein